MNNISSHNQSTVEEVTLTAVVIRCGCGDPDSHNGVRGTPTVCNNPKITENKGVIGCYKVSALTRLTGKVNQWLRSLRNLRNKITRRE